MANAPSLLEDQASNDTRQAENDYGARSDRRSGTTGLFGSSSATTRGITGRNEAASRRYRSGAGGRADAGGGGRVGVGVGGRSEGNCNTQTRFIGGLHIGCKLSEGLVAGSRCIDRTVHAAFAVPDTATEEPDWTISLGDVQREHTDAI